MKMINANIACCMDRKPYCPPRCEVLDIFAGQSLMSTSFIDPEFKDKEFDGTFDAPELMEFGDIEDDYDE